MSELVSKKGKKPRILKREDRERVIAEAVGNFCLSIKNADSPHVKAIFVFEELDKLIHRRVPYMVSVKREVEAFCKSLPA